MKMKRREGDPSSIKEKYGKENGTQESAKPDPEILSEENMRKCVPEDARRGLADLACIKRLYTSIFSSHSPSMDCCLKKMLQEK